MRTFLISLAALSLLGFLSLTKASADTATGWPNIAAFRAASTDPGTVAAVNCYYASPFPCAGGGAFRFVSGTCTDDGVLTVIADGKCYVRDDFGRNGVVDARQCGVVGDGLSANGVTGHPDDGALLEACLNIAAGLTIPVVNTGGGVILDNTTQLNFPNNVHLICGATSPSGGGPNDYRIFQKNDSTKGLNISNAIVINPLLLVPGTSFQAPIQFPGTGSAFSDCLVVAGSTDAGGTVIDPFAPSVWYPKCVTGTNCVDGNDSNDVYIRSAIQERDAFRHDPRDTCPSAITYGGPASCSTAILIGTPNGDGTYSGGSNTTIRNVTVVGFGICLLGTAPGLIVDNPATDCDSGIQMIDNNAPRLSNFTINPLATSGDIAVLGLDSAITQFSADGSGQYLIAVDLDTTMYPGFSLQDGDTIWVSPAAGAQSAAGRWTVYCGGGGAVCPTPDGCAVPGCQQLSLQSSYDSMSAPVSVAGTLLASGYAPTAITGIDFSTVDHGRGSFLSAGQIVTDNGTGGASCIDTSGGGTTVTAVWPARGIVFLSRPPLPTCTGPLSDVIQFKDATYNNASADCGNGTKGSAIGCVVVDTSYRFGDGFYARNSGGMRLFGGSTFEHGIGFHMDTGSRGEIIDTAAGNNVGLADRNLAALHDNASDPNLNGNIVTLLIEGEHSANPNGGSTLDACGINWTNGVLGQHRNNGIVVQSNCDEPDKIANVGLGVDNHTGNGVALEVDAGKVLLTNSASGTDGHLFKADQTTLPSFGGGTITVPAALRIGDNEFPGAPIYLANANAALTTSGCGNVFVAPTPYLCAPSSFTQLPGGRLTLVQGQPVMTADTTGTVVYYALYVSQQVPLYNTAAGAFGLSDAGASGLSLQLESTVQTASQIYDIFAGIENGIIQLCSGPAWSSSAAGSSSRSIPVTQMSGVWVNTAKMQCHFYPSGGMPDNQQCAAYECTYLGSIYTTTMGGQVSQQFSPPAANGGSNPCLCLYNAYNRVVLTSRSLDNTGYTYNSTAWRFMHGNSNNRVTVVDGLDQMQILAQLTDGLANGASPGRTAQMGVDFNVSSSVPAPVPTVQANAAATGTYGTGAPHTPYLGLWYAQAVEAAPSSGNAANFGGSNLQQLSVQVAD